MERLRSGLRITFQSEPLGHTPLIDKDIGHGTIVNISSMRDDPHWSAAKQLFQAKLGCRTTWLAQLRRVDAPESDAFGSISKRVAIKHVDMSRVEYSLDATERSWDWSTEH